MPPTCHFCGKQCTDDDYCEGCQTTVCGECDLPPDEAPSGEHDVRDHKIPAGMRSPFGGSWS